MFTGLIEAVGEVAEVEPTLAGLRLRVATTLAGELAPGDSVAVNGVCLTVIASDAGEMHADVSPETLRVTTLGTIQRGAAVNLERALQAGARLGGHLVQGHVDATGSIEGVRQDGDAYWLTVAYPSTMAALLVHKGSITVDGISLTVAGLDSRAFAVQIIPFTWSHTGLRHAKVGDSVNLEFDILGKYVARALEVARADAAEG